MKNEIIINSPLGLDSVKRIARDHVYVSLSEEARERVVSARRRVDYLISSGKQVYGVTTGVGSFSTTSITSKDMATLSDRIVLSHACGVGDPLAKDQVRAVMACAINNFARGYSGVRGLLVDKLIDFLNADLIPVVPKKGSVGYLSYMAHIGAVMMGFGYAAFNSEFVSSSLALSKAGIKPISFEAKEGISLVNGTPGATGLAALAIVDAERLLEWADVAGALTFEVLNGSQAALDPRIHELRPHQGQTLVALNLRRLLNKPNHGTPQVSSRLQDALSLRAMPQVHGAARDQVRNARHTVETELRSVTDNPILFDTEEGPEAVSGCNAHGQPISFAMDTLINGLATLGNISERRTFRLITPEASHLPAFLAKNGGLDSGLMIPQYVAASLVAENKVLSHPMSVDSIVTSGLQEDHVSFATPSTLKAATIIDNVQHILAIELLTAAQAKDMLSQSIAMGVGTQLTYELLREQVEPMEKDRFLSDDIRIVKELLENIDALYKLEVTCGIQ